MGKSHTSEEDGVVVIIGHICVVWRGGSLGSISNFQLSPLCLRSQIPSVTCNWPSPYSTAVLIFRYIFPLNIKLYFLKENGVYNAMKIDGHLQYIWRYSSILVL